MRRHLPTFTSLLCFEASARHLSFTRAGEELNLTQSAVSRQVRNLETFLKTDLFHRIKKRLVLSEEGKAYVGVVNEHLNGLESETLKLITKDQEDVRLNLGTFPTFGSRWLIPRLHEFSSLHPDIQFNLTTGLVPFDFSSQGIDVAIQHGDGNWENVETQKIIDETVVAVCAPALIEKLKSVEASSVLDFTMLNLQTRLYAWSEWLAEQGVETHISLRGPNFETFSMIIRAALSGLGVAVIPTMYIEEELEKGLLVSPFGHPIRSKRGYYLVSTKRKKTQAKVKAFIAWISSIESP